MGKKRIIKNKGGNVSSDAKARSMSKILKKKLADGIIHIQSTYNNTLINLTDKEGRSVTWSTSGSLGFKGAKKGTPFASSKVAEIIADKAKIMGLLEADIIVNGVGAGRESAIRTFAAKGIKINMIRDITPVPHNGVRPRKPRRV